MQEIKDILKNLAKGELNLDIEPSLSRPEEKFGDYSTNLAMQAGAKLGKNPREIAILLAGKLHGHKNLSKVEVAGPGFINLTLSDDVLLQMVNGATDLPKSLRGQEIVLEHTDPNPFKEFHIGHAYSNTVGVSIGKLLVGAGANVHQVSYHGDVGLHIAMAVFGLMNGSKDTQLGAAYAAGAQAYKDSKESKAKIEEINQQIYSGSNEEVNRLYADGRQQSLSEFERIHTKLGAKFEKNYFESETAVEGQKVVEKNMGSVFQKSDGAVIFDGEKVGLHKRVFITANGLPTYEAKEIGLAFAKDRDYPDADSFIVITANEIDDYFKVLVETIKAVDKKLGSKIRHISHGLVKLPEGKMSSRTGSVITFEDLLASLAATIKKTFDSAPDAEATAIAAMKYEFLKHRVGSDFIFDVAGSISLHGNSGPYIQYAHARSRAILNKAGGKAGEVDTQLEPGERSLARAISQFPEVVNEASAELAPSSVTTYLYELAQQFNSFYEHNRVLNDPRETLRLSLVQKYADVLKAGLELLNIEAPERV